MLHLSLGSLSQTYLSVKILPSLLSIFEHLRKVFNYAETKSGKPELSNMLDIFCVTNTEGIDQTYEKVILMRVRSSMYNLEWVTRLRSDQVSWLRLKNKWELRNQIQIKWETRTESKRLLAFGQANWDWIQSHCPKTRTKEAWWTNCNEYDSSNAGTKMGLPNQHKANFQLSWVYHRLGHQSWMLPTYLQ